MSTVNRTLALAANSKEWFPGSDEGHPVRLSVSLDYTMQSTDRKIYITYSIGGIIEHKVSELT
jgi:hypothetical protein